MAEQALDSWLRKSYFHPGQGGALAFVIVRSFSFFQYLLGQSVVGDVAGLAFVAGIVLLLRNKLTLPNSGPTRGQLAFLLVLPFAINAIAGVLDRYPYGGTRHSIFLTIFAIPGISLCLARITQQRKMWGIVAALAIPLLGFAFPTIRHPYISRTDQDRRQMDEAIGFIRDKIPASAPLFVDYESGITLGHYLCQQKQVVYDGSIPGFLSFSCGGHHLVSTIHDLWAFTPETFFDQWNDLVRNGNFEHGTTVWVGQVGWITDLDDQLREDFPAFHDLRTTAFGSNVKFFSLMVGQPIPSNIRPGHELERQPLAHLFSQNTKAELVGSALSPLL